MEIFKYQYSFNDPKFLEEYSEDLQSRIIKINAPNLVLNCLSLFEDEYFENIEVIYIDNIDLRTYLVLLNQKEIHFYLGINLHGKCISDGALFGHESVGFNMIALSFRYIIILKSLDYMNGSLNYYAALIWNFIKKTS